MFLEENYLDRWRLNQTKDNCRAMNFLKDPGIVEMRDDVILIFQHWQCGWKREKVEEKERKYTDYTCQCKIEPVGFGD